MKFSTVAVALAAIAAESVSAASIGRHAHRHQHEKKTAAKRWTPPPGYDWHTDAGNIWNPNAHAATPAAPAPAAPTPAAPAADNSSPDTPAAPLDDLMQGGNSIMSDIHSHIVSAPIPVSGKNVLAGANPTSPNDFVWLGTDSPYLNEITNNAASPVTLVVFSWSDGADQWIDQHAPAVTVNIPAGDAVTLAMADKAKGAFLAIHEGATWAQNGLMNTVIGEFNAGSAYSTFDVSMLWANSTSHGMAIDTGNGCRSSTEGECVFVCTKFDQGDNCGTAGSYELVQGAMGDKCNRAVIPDPWIPSVQVPTGGCTLYDGDDTKMVKTSIF